MVRSAVGADSTRGDVVSVVSVPFAPVIVAAIEKPKTDIVNIMQTAQRPLLGVLGLVLIIVVALISLKSLKSAGAAAGANPTIALKRADGSTSPALNGGAPMPVMMPTNTMRDRVSSTIEQQPDVAARVVRAWLKD
jgi:flagellar M-ring protein FliF